MEDSIARTLRYRSRIVVVVVVVVSRVSRRRHRAHRAARSPFLPIGTRVRETRIDSVSSNKGDGGGQKERENATGGAGKRNDRREQGGKREDRVFSAKAAATGGKERDRKGSRRIKRQKEPERREKSEG